MSDESERVALVAEIRAIIADHKLTVRGCEEWSEIMDLRTLRFFRDDIRHAAGLPPVGREGMP